MARLGGPGQVTAGQGSAWSGKAGWGPDRMGKGWHGVASTGVAGQALVGIGPARSGLGWLVMGRRGMGLHSEPTAGEEASIGDSIQRRRTDIAGGA